MKRNQVTIASLLIAGSLGSSVYAEAPTQLEPAAGRIVDVAHIYYNIASGERVVTLNRDSQTSGANTGESESIWSSRVGNPCESEGFSTSFFFGLDDNSDTSSLATNATLVDWGDISIDTVVDCVHIDWVTDHNDVDLDSDGIGDGVIGLAGQWTFTDCDNGRLIDFQSLREPIISFIFTDLPGDTSGTTGPDDPNNTLARYTADVDLAGGFSSSLVFEIGDSDGDLQGAAFGNSDVGDGHPIAAPGVDRDFDGQEDADLDGDNLFDWGWNVRFFQPGTADLDSDGNVDGDINDSFRTIGVSFGTPEGDAIDNGDGTWTWEINTALPDAGTGAEDAFTLLNQNLEHAGLFWFGGFSCTPDVNGQYTPRSDFYMQLFGPSGTIHEGCNDADLAEPYDTLNFFDVSAFLGAFNTQAPEADIAEPFGTWNFFDVSAFLGLFNAGCP